MRQQPAIGLLPLYLQLYDERLPEMRTVLDPFVDAVADAFAARRIAVTHAPVCRVRGEFETAVRELDKGDLDLLVTLHMAYSPSLESCGLLSQCALPILMLDTTLDYDFGLDVDPIKILYNHGIHGVMDLASMLRRGGKACQIVAGHLTESDVMDRATAIARAAYGARKFKQMRVLRIGESFPGMGDFSVPEPVLAEKLGISVEQIAANDLAKHVEAVTEKEIAAEIERDRSLFNCEASEEVHRRTSRLGLGLRKRLEEGGYGAFSMNFLAFNSADGPINTVPFLEACHAMARGIGYAGEGDVLTAALVGALAQGFGDTNFTEIFCPDWKGGSLFLSHMGEINPAIAASKPLLYEKPFPFTDAQNPATLACAPKPGPACFVNIAPGPDSTFTLLVAPVEMLGDARHPGMREWVRGWMRPQCALGEFLETYSRHGGTHHNALVLGQTPEALAAFAAFAGLPCVVIGR